jgi:hypothetical protein
MITTLATSLFFIKKNPIDWSGGGFKSILGHDS